MPTDTRYPSYADIQARHLASHLARARAALRDAAAAAAAAGARVIVFGSLAEGRFHRASDLDLAVDGPPEALDDLLIEIGRIAARHHIAIDALRLDHASPALAARIRDRGRDAASLE